MKHDRNQDINFTLRRGRRDRDRMVVRFTNTYAISAYHHWRCEFESSLGLILLFVIIK
jgi:succinate dehydrogenase flavin-adding protein (antitoxin of CptAB toxin-antitoxin module)